MGLDDATAKLWSARRDAVPLHQLSVAQAREYAGQLTDTCTAGPQMASERRGRIPVTGGVIPYLLLVPAAEPKALIVYYHGGGWVVGSIVQSAAPGRRLAAATGCAVLLVGYRQAPEHRFPTAAEDAWAGLVWTHMHGPELGLAEAPLIVAGESAGGNLAAVVTQRARRSGGPPILLQVLLCPVVDCDVESLSFRDPENQLTLSREAMIWFWDQYAPVAPDRLHPDASPLRQVDLTGLPPTVVVTAEHDVLRDEGEAYVTRLLEAGVTVFHRRFAGQMHGFVSMADVLPGGRAGLAFLCGVVSEQLRLGPCG